MVQVLFKSPATIPVSEETIGHHCTPLLVYPSVALSFTLKACVY